MTRTAPSTRTAATTPPSTSPPSGKVVTVPSFLPSTAFYLAAGTVTVDPAERKVLILHDPATDTYQLPRGRKDWGEGLPATAVRETLEETGYLPRLLAVPLATRATLPPAALADPLHPCHPAAGSARFDGAGEVLLPGTARLAEEPFGVMQHYQGNGALAVVAWFVGVADSRGQRREGTQMADEEYESLWVGYREAEEMMVDEAYAKVVRRGVELASAVVEEDGPAAVLSGSMPTEGRC
jgi:8-oxo-dGTP pyrophosphatase MutT (NUDIX family)